MMMKFGIVPSLPFGQGALPTSLQSGIGINSPLNQTSAGNMMQKASQSLTGSQPMQIGSPSENVTSKDNSFDPSFGNRTEKVLDNFLQNPLLKGEQGVQDGVVCTCCQFLMFICLPAFSVNSRKEKGDYGIICQYDEWILCFFCHPLLSIDFDA